MDIINDIINDLIPKRHIIALPEYNNYYQNQGTNHIKKRLKTDIDDSLFDLILEKEAENISTPLQEWYDKKFINNYCVFSDGFNVNC